MSTCEPEGKVMALTWAAVSLRNEGKLNEAREMALKAYEIDPRFFQGVQSLGIICQEMGRLEEGMKYLEEALQLVENVPPEDRKDAEKTTKMNIGNTLHQMAKKKCEERGVNLFPPDRLPPEVRGMLNRAVNYYEQAIALDSNYVLAHNGISIVLTMLGEYAKAFEHTEVVLRLTDNPAVRRQAEERIQGLKVLMDGSGPKDSGAKVSESSSKAGCFSIIALSVFVILLLALFVA